MTQLPCALVVMGVSGSGKSTVGALLAARLQWEFAHADWFHSAANVDKMHAGIALTDEDRRPWLEALAAWIEAMRRAGRHGVLACSAQKRRYREVLAGGGADVRFAYLKGDEALRARRIAAREEHFMRPALDDPRFGLYAFLLSVVAGTAGICRGLGGATAAVSCRSSAAIRCLRTPACGTPRTVRTSANRRLDGRQIPGAHAVDRTTWSARSKASRASAT